jgi:ATP-binding cassette subfamily F protein uup
LRRERAERRERQGKVNLAIDAGDRSGRLVAELVGVHKGFGGKRVVRDFSCRVLRGDRIGVIGPNGAGKTTLLRLFLGELKPDAGAARLGTKIQTAYFDQFRSQLDEDATLADVISPGSDFVQIGKERKHVVGYLGDFLFAPERARSPVRSLSGGERNRLLLARLFARPANVLVLDEPTNDLDIETLELLEQLLQEYAGTLFLVSHDRAFLDNVVTQTIVAEEDGAWREYAGGYQDWADHQAQCKADDAAPAPAGRKENAAKVRTGGSRKLSYREARELAGLPVRIGALEDEQKEITLRLGDPALYQTDPQTANTLAARLAEIDGELTALLERWEELEPKFLG